MSETFEKELSLPVSAAEAFTWHERPGALDRLIPPWEAVTVVRRGNGIQDDSTVELLQRVGPIKTKWIAKHHDYEPGRVFHDTQVFGPFARWEHSHDFQPRGDNHSVLVDRVEYQIPGGQIGRWLGGQFVRKKIESMFRYRHDTTRDDLAAHSKYLRQGSRHVAVTGASGLVGSNTGSLTNDGRPSGNSARSSHATRR